MTPPSAPSSPDRRRTVVAALERRQVPLYLGALALGMAVGWRWDGAAGGFETAITPCLMVLLFATFLAVPFARLREPFRDGRFLGAALLLNFAVVPAVVGGLSRFVAHDRALLIGVLLVLLTPCIDYVVVFTRLAGGDAARLLAAAPLLMLVQMMCLPALLALFGGGDVVGDIDWAPFARAFVLFIVIPLGLAVLAQRAARRGGAAEAAVTTTESLMVPVMVITLAVIAASQASTVIAHADRLGRVIPVFVAFLVVMPLLGALLGRAFHLGTPARRALVFTGSTRNSLVVLPLALSLPTALDLAAVVVVTQTLVELIAMVIMVRAVPRRIR